MFYVTSVRILYYICFNMIALVGLTIFIWIMSMNSSKCWCACFFSIDRYHLYSLFEVWTWTLVIVSILFGIVCRIMKDLNVGSESVLQLKWDWIVLFDLSLIFPDVDQTNAWIWKKIRFRRRRQWRHFLLLLCLLVTERW